MHDKLRLSYGHFHSAEKITRRDHEAAIKALQLEAQHWEETAAQRTEQALEIARERDGLRAEHGLLQAELLRVRAQLAQLQAIGQGKQRVQADAAPGPGAKPLARRVPDLRASPSAGLSRGEVARQLLRVANEAYRFAKEGGEQFFLADLPGREEVCDEILRLAAAAHKTKG